MGIFVNLDIIPSKISETEWTKAYEECLNLVNAYHFMDKIIDNSTYSLPWIYTQKTTERKLSHIHNEIGFYIFGDMLSLQTAENFELISNINHYRHSKNPPNYDPQDILVQLISNKHSEFSHYCSCIRNVFDSKTQGLDYHKYLLAIACVIESRFPKYAMVTGDISKGQLEEAINWANTILDTPINISQRCNNCILLNRLKTLTNDPFILLDTFMSTTLNETDMDMGIFLLKNFKKETIIEYFSNTISSHQIGSIGFMNSIFEYFNLGFELDLLCDICISKQNQNTDTITKFIKCILNLNMHLENEERRLEKKEIDEFLQYNTYNPKSNKPDTIESLFGKLFLSMTTGFEKQSDRFITLSSIRTILNNKLGKFCNINQIIDNELQSVEKKSIDRVKSINDLQALADIEDQLHEEYDISDIDDLIYWNKDLSISPEVKKNLDVLKQSIKDLIVKNASTLNELYQLDNNRKMEALIKSNQFFYINKNSWDYIINNLENKNVFASVYMILNIVCNEKNINTLLKSALNNIDFLNWLIN